MFGQHRSVSITDCILHAYDTCYESCFRNGHFRDTLSRASGDRSNVESGCSQLQWT